MVIAGIAKEEERAQKLMAMGPERSKSLHNFSMPWLKWGNQRFLRCMKVDSTAEVPTADHHPRSLTPSESDRSLTGSRYQDSEPEKKTTTTKRRSPSASQGLKTSPVRKLNVDNTCEDDDDGDGGLESVRERLMVDLKTAADKMKVAILNEGNEEASAAVDRPWNLRTRRAACKAPISNVKNVKIDERKISFTPMRSESPMKSPRMKGGGGGNGTEKKKERAKFRVPLSRKEIEEDYMAMLGERPPRRPKKRPRIVQKQLDLIFPGLWLTEVTADTYKVPELPESGKR